MNTALPLTGRDLSPSLLRAIDSAVRRAIDEDIGQGDLTAELVPQAQRARATIVCREPAVICGQPWVSVSGICAKVARGRRRTSLSALTSI